MAYSKEAMQEMLKSIEESIVAHESQRKLHENMLKGERFLKRLIEEELEKFK
jgi:hypothetical protein